MEELREYIREMIQEMIRKNEKGWSLFSHKKAKDGKQKRLGGPYGSREEAEEREREVNYFKASRRMKSILTMIFGEKK